MPQDYADTQMVTKQKRQDWNDKQVKRLQMQADKLWFKFQPAHNTFQQLADYIIPAKSNITRKRTPGTQQTHFVFDGTAEDSNAKLASFLSTSLTSMAIQFFSLRVPEADLKLNPEVGKWLDEVGTIAYEEFKASNFPSEVQECFNDIGAFGHLTLQHTEKDGNERWNGALFKAHAPGTHVFSEDHEGRVNVIFVKLEMTIDAMISQWGLPKLSERTQRKAEKEPFEETNVMWAVFPRALNPELNGPPSKEYWSVYFEPDAKHIIDVGGFEEFPFHVARWRKISGEVTGRGPGHAALPDIRTINRADELTLKAWGKAIEPPLQVLADQVIGRVRSSPAALNVVRQKDAITPIASGANWQANAQEFEKRRMAIKSAFYADQLQLPDKTIITATEVERRIELAQQILGPVVGRLEYELLDPLVRRMYNQLNRAGKIPPPPQILQDAARVRGTQVRVQYEGPLARVAKGGELQALNRLFTATRGYIELNPQSTMLDGADEDALFEFLVDATGSPSFILREEAERDAIREQRAQAAQQQAQAQSASQMGAAVQSGAKAMQTFQQTPGLGGGSEEGQ